VVADSLEGGLGAAASAHADYFAERGWTVGLAAPGATSNAATWSGWSVDLAVPKSAFDLRDVLRCARQLRRQLMSAPVDIVHAHGLRSQLIVLLAGRRPFVTRHSGGRLEQWSFAGSVVRHVFSVLAPALSRGAFSVSPRGTGWKATPTASPLLRSLGELPPEAMDAMPLFVWVGRLDTPKRPADFVRAVAMASQRSPCRGAMLGSGPLEAAVREVVAKTHAPVELLGDVPDVRPWLARARALCLLSDSEGMPFSVQEAMWAGRAVVVSPLPGIRWFAGDDALYAVNAAEAAAAFERLVDPDQAARLGRTAAAHARRMLHPDAPLPDVEAAYRRVLAASR
jgi:glycosyltransferase involved in cell wall biosynthesis